MTSTDPGSVPWVVRPFELLKAGLFVVPDGGRGIINHVYVDNLVDAIFLAIERDASGAYTVTDGVGATCLDYFRPLAEAAGRRASARHPPRSCASRSRSPRRRRRSSAARRPRHRARWTT